MFKYLKTRKYHLRGRTMSPPTLPIESFLKSPTYSSWTKTFFTRNLLVSRNVSSSLSESCSPRTTLNDCGNLDISCNLSNRPLAKKIMMKKINQPWENSLKSWCSEQLSGHTLEMFNQTEMKKKHWQISSSEIFCVDWHFPCLQWDFLHKCVL